MSSCEQCGNPKKKETLRFCSVTCRNTHNAGKQKRQGVTRKCVVCDLEFYTTPRDAERRPALYCSHNCAGASRQGSNNVNYKPKVQRICQHCGESFETYPVRVKQGRGKYCSSICASESRKVARVKIPCDTCGEIIEITFSRFLTSKKHFCSLKCNGITTPAGKGTVLPCDTCEELIELSSSKFGASERHFCSNECYSVARKKPLSESKRKVSAICRECEKEFYASAYDKPKHGHRFCSHACFGAWRAKNAHVCHSRARGGKRDDLGGLYVRSSWEANWARYLNWLVSQGEIVKWEYEPQTFWFDGIKRGSRSYTPDFKVYLVDGTIEYHEIKGYMDPVSKTKLKRMSKYFPDIPVKLIDKEAYYALAKDVRGFIPGWERR